MSRYIGVTDTAKMMRVSLKKAFPGVKFSVRSESYSGGASIRVNWTDGPTVSEVDAVTGLFRGKRFDGSIDLEYGADHWLHPDGTVSFAGTYGHSFSSENTLDRASAEPPVPGAELIHFGSGYVSTSRELSKDLRLKAAARVIRERGLDFTPGDLVDESPYGPKWSDAANGVNLGGNGYATWLTDVLYRAAYRLRADGVFVTAVH